MIKLKKNMKNIKHDCNSQLYVLRTLLKNKIKIKITKKNYERNFDTWNPILVVKYSMDYRLN